MHYSKKRNCIFVFIFLVAIIAPMISWGIIKIYSIENPGINDVVDYDLGENRLKATMSEVLTLDNVTSEIEKYYNDRIPYRSVIITAKKNFDNALEKPYKDNIEMVLMRMLSNKKGIDKKVAVQADEVDGKIVRYMDDAVDIFLNHGLKKEEIDPYDPYIEYPVKYLNDSQKVIVGQSNWLYLNIGNIPYYKGVNTPTNSGLKYRLSCYKATKDLCESLGKRFAIMVCPEKEEIYPEYMPYMEITNERETPLYVRDYVATHSNLIYLYPKEELTAAKKKYLTYRKYDSHWNAVGGYIAANKLKEALGLETIPLRDLKIHKTNDVPQDLVYYGGATDTTFPKTIDYVLEYKYDVPHERFFVEDATTNESFSTRSQSENKKRLFLAGDSYRFALSEYLVKDYYEFYCNTYLNIEKDFIWNEVKRADDIVFVVVERNEEVVLPQLCTKICEILHDYENDIRELTEKLNKQS